MTDNHIEPRVATIENTLGLLVSNVQELHKADARHEMDIALLRQTVEQSVKTQRDVAHNVEAIRSRLDQSEGFWKYAKRISMIITVLIAILTTILALEHAHLLIQNSENLMHWRSMSSANNPQFASGNTGDLPSQFEYSLNR